MPTLLAPVAIQQFKDSYGNPLVGGQLYTYQAGTSIPAPSYTDATGTSANSNPVILNSRGEAPIWLTPGQIYKIVLMDAASVLIWSADQIPGGFIDAALLPDTASSNKLRTDIAAYTGATLIGFTNAQNAVSTLAGLAKQQSMRNDKNTVTAAGECPGLKVGICDGTSGGWLLNPGAGDFVAIYPYITSSAVRTRVWAMNPIVDIPAGFPATAWCYEGNVNVGTANTPDPRVVNHALGADMVSGGTFAPSAAFATYSSTLANRWKHGLWFDNIGGQAGSALIKSNANVDVDFGLDIGSATIRQQGIRVGVTPPTVMAAVGIRQLVNGQAGIFLQRNTDTSPSGQLLSVVNATNSAVLAYIDATGTFGVSNITPIGGPLLVNGTIAVTGDSTANGIHQSQCFRATGAAVATVAGQVSYGATVAATASAGTNGAAPAQVLCYINITVNGVAGKIPVYNP